MIESTPLTCFYVNGDGDVYMRLPILIGQLTGIPHLELPQPTLEKLGNHVRNTVRPERKIRVVHDGRELWINWYTADMYRDVKRACEQFLKENRLHMYI